MGLAQRKYTDEQIRGAIDIIDGDHTLFARDVLKIYNKAGNLVPFIHNKAQREFFKVWDESIRRFGYVRIIVVKARRHGISTAIAGRFYHEIIKADTWGKKKNALVVAQDDDSSTALFDITDYFQQNAGEFAPKLISDSGHKLETRYSVYKCMTAGKQRQEKGSGKGRGMTAQLIHLSELAHISNAENLANSLLLTVAKESGTAIIMESTANGEGDYFHSQYLAAKAGKIDFLPFFAPWYWDKSNQTEVRAGFELTDDDVVYMNKYGLNMRQMAWRRNMEHSLGLTEKQGRAMFKQEYPADDEEAFSFSSTDSYISSSDLMEAIERPPKTQDVTMPVIAAYDPSHKGRDRDAFIMRHGSNIFGLELPAFDENDFDARVRFLQDKLDNKVLGIDMLFMDAGGGGYQIRSRLNNLGYGNRVRWIEFGAGADNQNKAKLKRDEMYVDFNDLLTDKHDPLSISIPDKDLRSAFIVDMTAAGYKKDDKNRIRMEPKESIKTRLKMSTDIADATIMLVAAKVNRKQPVLFTQYQSVANE